MNVSQNHSFLQIFLAGNCEQSVDRFVENNTFACLCSTLFMLRCGEKISQQTEIDPTQTEKVLHMSSMRTFSRVTFVLF